jgi:flagellar basal-body rod protein FlgB
LQRALDGTWQREKTVAATIANHETPGYKAVKVSFEDAIERAVQGMRGRSQESPAERLRGLESIKQANISVFQDTTYSERADASNVNLELENVEMAKVQIQYSYLSRQMTDAFTRLRYAVREGR